MVPAGKEDADALRRSPLEALRRIVSSAAGSAAVNRPPLCSKSSPPLR